MNQIARTGLYECENLIEAHLLKGMLEQCDIDVVLQGESLTGGVGELPANGLLVLWVQADKVELARTLIAEYEQQNNEGGAKSHGIFLA
jgi:hypothetical protein